MDLAAFCKILTVNLKHNFLPHFLAALVITALTPLIMGISSLDEINAARPVEMMLSLTGIMLLTPIFLPEQNENIRDLIRSKKTNYLNICVMRLAYSIIALALITGCFVLFMGFYESEVTIKHFTGGFISALFLGTLGFFSAGLSGNTTVGYMVSMIYYIANFSLKDKLGRLFLFSMSAGSFKEKYYLALASIMLILITLPVTLRPRR